MGGPSGWNGRNLFNFYLAPRKQSLNKHNTNKNATTKEYSNVCRNFAFAFPSDVVSVMTPTFPNICHQGTICIFISVPGRRGRRHWPSICTLFVTPNDCFRKSFRPNGYKLFWDVLIKMNNLGSSAN